jgi:DNA-binding MarR family transcriptional regulator
MKSSRTRLLPLFFEMGRMLKSEISRGGAALPSYLHLETLRFIQMREKQGLSSTMSDVSEYLKVARPSATALIQGLVRDDILVRQPDPHDRRVVRLWYLVMLLNSVIARLSRSPRLFQNMIVQSFFESLLA